MQVQSHRKQEDSETSDGALVQRALAGDQEAFEALVYRYKPSLFQLIYHYVGECDEAHDVLQQVWLQLYLSLGILCVRVPIKPWLFKVARNCSIDALRRKCILSFSEVETGNEGEGGSSLDSIPDMNLTPEELVERHDLQRSVRCAIQALPQKYRSIVLLYYEGQLDLSEIGQILNRPYSTVKAQFRRATATLRTALTAQPQKAATQTKTKIGTSTVAQ
jgi:RNA polymerase sigma factor (sigma-70 family)